MIMDFSKPGVLTLDMRYYIKNILEQFPEQITPSKIPWNDRLMKIPKNEVPIKDEQRETFHTFVMKLDRTSNQPLHFFQPESKNQWIQTKDHHG